MELLMKTMLIALALIATMAAPSFAQRIPSTGHYNESPASGSYGGNGY
jgi:hypothetical protein